MNFKKNTNFLFYSANYQPSTRPQVLRNYENAPIIQLIIISCTPQLIETAGKQLKDVYFTSLALEVVLLPDALQKWDSDGDSKKWNILYHFYQLYHSRDEGKHIRYEDAGHVARSFTHTFSSPDHYQEAYGQTLWAVKLRGNWTRDVHH